MLVSCFVSDGTKAKPGPLLLSALRYGPRGPAPWPVRSAVTMDRKVCCHGFPHPYRLACVGRGGTMLTRTIWRRTFTPCRSPFPHVLLVSPPFFYQPRCYQTLQIQPLLCSTRECRDGGVSIPNPPLARSTCVGWSSPPGPLP